MGLYVDVYGCAMQLPAAKAYTSRYLSAVQAATNTVSSWLMNGGNSDEVPSPVAAAAEQLRDEDMCQPKREVREISSHAHCLKWLACVS